mgnify:CR=1 FL=1
MTGAKRPARSPEVSAAIRSSFAVGLAVAAYGVSFGALAVAAGLDVWQTCVLSLLMFSGGSQFALVGVLATGGTAAGGAAIASAVLLGARNSLYALRVAPMIGPGVPKRLLAGHWTIDETTAIGAAVVAALLMPVLPAGVPVLAATLVAVVVGLTNWLGTRESDLAEAEPDPMGER